MDTDFILRLYSLPETVFTVNEIALLFPHFSTENLRNKLYYFSKTGKLKRLHMGMYAKEGYNRLELVNKLYKPSYISLETVLAKEGIIFQYYETIFAVSYVTREVTVDHLTAQYRRIKGPVLTNASGIAMENDYYIASGERAFLDAVYIYKNYHFDNLDPIDWDTVSSLKKIYDNASFEKKIDEYYKTFKETHAKYQSAS